MNILLKYDFPGNIRELENIIEYGFVVCKESIIQVEHLPAELIQPNESGSIEKQIKSTSLFKTMNEQNQLESALIKHNGHISKVAAELGIHRTTLWRKLKRYNIDINQIKTSK